MAAWHQIVLVAPLLVELPRIELENRHGLSITGQLDPAVVDTLLRLAALVISTDPMQAFVTSSLEKPCDKICVVVANEIHTAPVFMRNIDEFLALDKAGLKRGEFLFADHLVTLRQQNHADDLIEVDQRGLPAQLHSPNHVR